jgi:hypothetical protein
MQEEEIDPNGVWAGDGCARPTSITETVERLDEA